MNVVMIGATRGMGRALARQLAARGDQIFLLGRDVDDLERSGADLVARAGRPIVAGLYRCDLAESHGFAAALAAAAAAMGKIDVVVVSAGLFAPAAAPEADLALCERMLTVNFTGTLLFCEVARPYLLDGGGTLVVFSSVAGERGRKPVGLYGASKAGLSLYLESLDHRFSASGLAVVTVKPGFVRTAMTAGLPEPPFAGEPDDVASRVVRAIDRGTPVVYAPAIWRLVMWVIRLLPRFVMRRIGF